MKVSYTPVNGWYCESSSKARRTYRQRIVHLGEKGQQVVSQRGGQRRRQETLLNLGIVSGVHGEIEQIVLGQETVKDIGGQDNAGRHCDTHAREATRDAVVVQQVPDERQSACFPAQRTYANPQEIAVGRLEGRRIELASG